MWESLGELYLVTSVRNMLAVGKNAKLSEGGSETGSTSHPLEGRVNQIFRNVDDLF